MRSAKLNRSEKMTVLIVEQNAFHALRLAHRGYVMVNGEITLSGSGNELLQRPEIRAAYLEGRTTLIEEIISFYEPETLFQVIFVTVVLGGGCAWMTGRAIAIDMAAAVARRRVDDFIHGRRAVSSFCPL